MKVKSSHLLLKHIHHMLHLGWSVLGVPALCEESTSHMLGLWAPV
eukprot:CAMPEP_0119376172 /NCGR_PEP_ID=MMETSP1334-20130426/39318_1 /TAXON_ID=127549 /ORGANISM="Calcidiscus leptoporus, Strain RCC1130" /LENGTH=44 /DNA_ID= /DNA_START= /DNA_END= /DNA_ORIENTATION=